MSNLVSSLIPNFYLQSRPKLTPPLSHCFQAVPPPPRPHSCKARPLRSPPGGRVNSTTSRGPSTSKIGVSVHLGGSSLDFWGSLPQHLLASPCLWPWPPAPGLAPACTSRVTASAPSGLPTSPKCSQVSTPCAFSVRPAGSKGLPSAPGITEASSSISRPSLPPHGKHKTSGARGGRSLAWLTGQGSYLLVLGAEARPRSSRAGPAPSS